MSGGKCIAVGWLFYVYRLFETVFQAVKETSMIGERKFGPNNPIRSYSKHNAFALLSFKLVGGPDTENYPTALPDHN